MILTPNNFHIEYNPGNQSLKQLSHSHSIHEIIFALDGFADFIIENKKYTLSRNQLLFISNFEKHEHSSISDSYKRYILLTDNQLLDFSDTRLLSVFMNRPADYSHVLQLSEADAKIVENYFTEMMNEYKNPKAYSSRQIKLKLCELLIFLFRSNPSAFSDFSSDSYAATVGKVQKYLNENFNKSISLKETATLFYTDMCYLSSKFKEIVGYTFKQYLTALRLSYAKQLLVTTKSSVADICLECGFNDLSNFLRTFKQIEKITPLQFRITNTN